MTIGYICIRNYYLTDTCTAYIIKFKKVKGMHLTKLERKNYLSGVVQLL